MEAHDFKMPSPKRQRTNSPEIATQVESLPITVDSVGVRAEEKPFPNHVPATTSDNDILDVLLQHVEEESTPQPTVHATAPSTDQILPDPLPTEVVPDPNGEKTLAVDNNTSQMKENIAMDCNPKSENSVSNSDQMKALQDFQPSEHTHASTEVDFGIPAPHITAQTSMVIEGLMGIDGIPVSEGVGPPADTEGAEWEIDSSPYESSSDSDSTDTSSSEDGDDVVEDEDADDDYAMLDPEEQARILMHGDGGSDDEGGTGKIKAGKTGLKTANEELDDAPPIPDIVVTESMKIEELGVVEGIVENNVLIKAKVSGEYQVLESGSLLCFADRQVVGVVAETLGRVEQPLYTMRFRSEEDIQSRKLEKGAILFYVQPHSSFVFTQPLKAVKGSDASNIHDEEVGDDEMEFSDDEAEAEHKRQLKLKRQGRVGEGGRGRGAAKSRGGRGGRGGVTAAHDTNGAAYGNGSLEMNYDDVPVSEEGYNVLSRPSNFHELMGSDQVNQSAFGNITAPPHVSKPRSNGLGRGGSGSGRDRGRGNGRGNVRGRGGYLPGQHHNHQQHSQQSQSQYQNGYETAQFPPSFAPPPPPMLTPQNQYLPGPSMTSPMSPLPQQRFNFSSSFPNPQFPNYQQQQTSFHQSSLFNPALMQQFAQQQQHQQAGGYNNQWQPNQAAVAEVQRQLEEMRRAASQGGQHQ